MRGNFGSRTWFAATVVAAAWAFAPTAEAQFRVGATFGGYGTGIGAGVGVNTGVGYGPGAYGTDYGRDAGRGSFSNTGYGFDGYGANYDGYGNYGPYGSGYGRGYGESWGESYYETGVGGADNYYSY